MKPIEAEAVVPASPADVFAFLLDLRNHWLVADRFVDVVEIEPAGGVVRVSGPLGLGRTAVTRVNEVAPDTRIAGTAEIGATTRAGVTWCLAPRGESTRVRLEASVERASVLDRLLLLAGGRMWLERRFAGTLARLVDNCCLPAPAELRSAEPAASAAT